MISASVASIISSIVEIDFIFFLILSQTFVHTQKNLSLKNWIKKSTKPATKVVLPDPVFPITFTLHPMSFGIRLFSCSSLIHCIFGNILSVVLL